MTNFIDVEELLTTFEEFVCKNNISFIIIYVHTNQLTIKNKIALEDFNIEDNLDYISLTGKELELELNNITNIIYAESEENICVIETTGGKIYIDYI